jgi:hypothetical protein
MDFQPLDLRAQIGLAGQDRRHRDQASQCGRNPVLQLQPRQGGRAEAPGDRTIDQRGGRDAQRQYCGQRPERQPARSDAQRPEGQNQQ